MGRSKKNSDEKRSRKKNKSKSRKRRRRYSFSPSSSRSSGSEDSHSRSGRRYRRSKEPEKRRTGSAGPDRRKSRKKTAKVFSRRGVSVSSSSSYSSRSCSTCRGRIGSPGIGRVSEGRRRRSRSPSVRSNRKEKSKMRSRPRGRGRARSRRRTSRSCSSCGGSSSSSPRGRSPVRERSPSKNNCRQIEQTRLHLSEMIESNESKLTQEKISAINEDRDKTGEIYDEIPRSVNDTTRSGYEHGCHEEWHVVVNKKQPVKSTNTVPEDTTGKKSGSVNNVSSIEDDDDIESQLRKQALENLRRFRGSPSRNARFAEDVKKDSSDTQQQEYPLKVLLPRQGALDSFTKSQHTTLPDTRSIDFMEKESSHTYCHDNTSGVVDAHGAYKSLNRTKNYSFHHRSIQSENQQKPRIRSIIHIPTEKVALNQEISIQHSENNSGASNISCQDKADDSQSILNKGNTREESTNRMVVSELNSLEKEKQHGMASEVVESSGLHKAEVNKVGDELASKPSTINPESGNGCKKEDSGSQFQKKTFSRTHDGELMQVSYKVYIPQKAPALARRKLQQ